MMGAHRDIKDMKEEQSQTSTNNTKSKLFKLIDDKMIIELTKEINDIMITIMIMGMMHSSLKTLTTIP